MSPFAGDNPLVPVSQTARIAARAGSPTAPLPPPPPYGMGTATPEGRLAAQAVHAANAGADLDQLERLHEQLGEAIARVREHVKRAAQA